MNKLLLCNTCVSASQQEKFKSLLAKPDPMKEEKLEKTENEMKKLKETVSKIKKNTIKTSKTTRSKTKSKGIKPNHIGQKQKQ